MQSWCLSNQIILFCKKTIRDLLVDIDSFSVVTHKTFSSLGVKMHACVPIVFFISLFLKFLSHAWTVANGALCVHIRAPLNTTEEDEIKADSLEAKNVTSASSLSTWYARS